ncbi:MAG: hypothetical protein FWH27_10755 [Planctomycetaceae bacterium]|nr:hypothetical protein [Planctomycetaceae bacterium]
MLVASHFRTFGDWSSASRRSTVARVSASSPNFTVIVARAKPYRTFLTQAEWDAPEFLLDNALTMFDKFYLCDTVTKACE